MLPEEKRGRQERLSQIILELSEKMLDKTEYELYLNRLNSLYKENYKHQYSDFFPTILKVLEADNAYSIDFLSNNLDALGTYLDEQVLNGNMKYENMYDQFTKLCDHLDLQIRQTNYYHSMIEKSGDAKQELQSSITQLENANKRIDEATQRADTMQTQLISILSIFAAIIITFSGSFTFLGSSVVAISTAEYQESVIAAAIICGIFLFNTVFLLMYFVSKLTGRSIYVECVKQDCRECEEACGGLKKIMKRMPYVFFLNIIAIGGIIVDLIVWLLDIQGFIP